jgi:hypothetical protein
VDPWLLLLVKALVGGVGVIAFTLVARVVKPERLSGVFCAAPSVAVGSLAVVVLNASDHEGMVAAKGMVLGSIALLGASIVGALVARPADGSAVPISIATGITWLAIAGVLAAVVW